MTPNPETLSLCDAVVHFLDRFSIQFIDGLRMRHRVWPNDLQLHPRGARNRLREAMDELPAFPENRPCPVMRTSPGLEWLRDLDVLTMDFHTANLGVSGEKGKIIESESQFRRRSNARTGTSKIR